jgi:hypothetical protein
MQIYINEHHQNSAVLKTVRPNNHKVFVRNIISVSGIAAIIILVLIYLDKMVGLDVFMMPLEMLGITINQSSILTISIFVFLGASIIFLVLNYLNINNLRYEFYDDRIVLYESSALVFLTHKEISYKNIVKISFNYNGFMNKILSSGEIVIDVTGMKEGSMKMEMMDQTEELVAQLLKIIKEHNSLQQMQFEENYKIGKIMNKF